jgi:hypothetical protein
VFVSSHSNRVVRRVIHLYYYRDADRVVSIVNSIARLKKKASREA